MRGPVQMRPTREVQTLVMMAMMRVVSVMMMPAPMVMPVTMMAVMPMPTVVEVPPVVAHLNEACIHHSGQSGGRTKVSRFRRIWRSREQSKAKGQSEYHSPEHISLLRHGAVQAHALERAA